MLDSITRQLDLVRASLRSLYKKVPPGAEQSQQAIALLSETHSVLRSMVRNGRFDSEKDEIHYFRHLKPYVVGRILYHQRIYHLELQAPKGPKSQLCTYYERALEELFDFFADNADFIRYIRSGDTLFDGLYFVRRNFDFRRVPDGICCELDPEQTTYFDLKTARLLAYEDFAQYVTDRLEALRQESAPAPAPDPAPSARETSGTQRWLKSHQVERLLGISKGTLQTLRKKGEIPFVVIGGTCYYDEAAILKLLRGRGTID